MGVANLKRRRGSSARREAQCFRPLRNRNIPYLQWQNLKITNIVCGNKIGMFMLWADYRERPMTSKPEDHVGDVLDDVETSRRSVQNSVQGSHHSISHICARR